MIRILNIISILLLAALLVPQASSNSEQTITDIHSFQQQVVVNSILNR